jgi:hypothetical protein
MNCYNMKQATAAARRHGYLRTWWRDSRATGKRFFLRLGRGRQKPGSFELYWLLSAGVHRVVKCSGFRLLNDYSVRAHPPVFNAVAVKLAVNRYVHPFAGATCAPPTRSH